MGSPDAYGAGNSIRAYPAAIARTVYPRRCGEQGRFARVGFPPGGLSPQVRGTGAAFGCRPGGIRFIPAGAGNSFAAPGRHPEPAVYPRRCGEQSRSWGASRSRVGLSPQVRGTGLGQGANAVERRFIPAGAGNRGCGGRCRRSPAVYPRRCGEQPNLLALVWRLPGLSPQVRGTGLATPSGSRPTRFIPAGAGNRVASAGLSATRPVYPRRCGEQSMPPTPTELVDGLSPQVRGTDP